MYPDRPEDIAFKNDVRARKREVLDRTITDATSNDFNERFVREVATQTGVDLSTAVYDRTRRGAEMIVESWQNKINEVMAEPWTLALRPQTVRDLLWHAEYDRVMQKIGPETYTPKAQLRRQELDRFSDTLDQLVNRDVSDLSALNDASAVHTYSPVEITDDFAQYLLDNQNTEATGTIAEAIAIIDHADPDATTTDVAGTIDNPGRDASAFFAEPDAYHTGAQGTLEQYYRMILGELDIETDLQDCNQTRNDTELTHRPATHLELIACTQEFQDSNLEHPASYSGAYLLTVCPQSRQAFFDSCLSPGLDNPQGIADDYRAKMRVIAEGLIQQNRRKLKRNPELCEELYEISRDLDLQRDILDILLRARDSEGTRMVPWRKIGWSTLGLAGIGGAVLAGGLLFGDKKPEINAQSYNANHRENNVLTIRDGDEFVKFRAPNGTEYFIEQAGYEALEPFLGYEGRIQGDLASEVRFREFEGGIDDHVVTHILHAANTDENDVISADEIGRFTDAYDTIVEYVRTAQSEGQKITMSELLKDGRDGSFNAPEDEGMGALTYSLLGIEAGRTVEEVMGEVDDKSYLTKDPETGDVRD